MHLPHQRVLWPRFSVIIIAGCQNAGLDIRPLDEPAARGAALVREERGGFLADPSKDRAPDVPSPPASVDVAPLTVPASTLRPRPRTVTRRARLLIPYRQQQAALALIETGKAQRSRPREA